MTAIFASILSGLYFDIDQSVKAEGIFILPVSGPEYNQYSLVFVLIFYIYTVQLLYHFVLPSVNSQVAAVSSGWCGVVLATII